MKTHTQTTVLHNASKKNALNKKCIHIFFMFEWIRERTKTKKTKIYIHEKSQPPTTNRLHCFDGAEIVCFLLFYFCTGG